MDAEGRGFPSRIFTLFSGLIAQKRENFGKKLIFFKKRI
jgi:hypothetical protein